MNFYRAIIENIQHYIEQLFSQFQDDCLLYHNLDHTKFVVEKANEIAANYNLDETELFILSASAWFHDTGQLNGGPKAHEERSVLIMKGYFEGLETKKSVVHKIEACIYATKMPSKPRGLVQEILCDADTYNLGTDDFVNTDDLLRMELDCRSVSTDNWIEKTLQLLSTHQYYTSYCKKILNTGKEKNVALLQSQLH